MLNFLFNIYIRDTLKTVEKIKQRYIGNRNNTLSSPYYFKYFQNLGMSFVVGAYVFGLAMSKTDIVYVIQDKLTIFERFFIPIFFTSIGLMSDINEILSKEVLILGLAISAIAILTKSIFCFIPALFLGFNKLGALKIAVGMVPRGEVSLIMANVALSSGFISQKYLES